MISLLKQPAFSMLFYSRSNMISVDSSSSSSVDDSSFGAGAVSFLLDSKGVSEEFVDSAEGSERGELEGDGV